MAHRDRQQRCWTRSTRKGICRMSYEPPTIGVNRVAALLPPNVTHIRARLDRRLTA